MKKCRPRELMPQIDLADYPAFVSFCEANGVGVRPTILPPHVLRTIQCNGPWQEKLVKETTLAKPILTTADRFIIDGNTRWRSHIKLQSLAVPCYVIELSLIDAIRFVHTFPLAYTYKGGQQPERA